MNSIRRLLGFCRRLRGFGRRIARAWDLYSRLGFPPAHAWRRAGEWE